MKCTNCREEIETEYVTFGGAVWCSEDCLAEFTVEKDMDVDLVAREMEYRSVK